MAEAIRRRDYLFFAPTRSIRLIERAGRPPFSAISRSCSMMKPRAGSSPLRPPRIPLGTRRLEEIGSRFFGHGRLVLDWRAAVPWIAGVPVYAAWREGHPPSGEINRSPWGIPCFSACWGLIWADERRAATRWQNKSFLPDGLAGSAPVPQGLSPPGQTKHTTDLGSVACSASPHNNIFREPLSSVGWHAR
jgi:hypothetical protein